MISQQTINAERARFLKELVETPGVPGREDLVRNLLTKRAQEKRLFDELRTDALGSLIGVRKPRASANAGTNEIRRILLSAHMDQVGFLVSHISDRGFLRVHPVGAFDPRALISQRVKVVTEDGAELTGVLCPEGHPVHTREGRDEPAKPTISQFYVDLGGSSAAGQVRQGDMVAFSQPLDDLGFGFAGPALDNRLGCWALMTALEELDSHQCEIIAVWSSQEELGSRGIEPISANIRPDIGISCDTVNACDVPGVPAEQEVCRLGNGVALVVADSSTLADMTLVRRFETIARDHEIKVQRCLMEGGGQDGAYIQRSGSGVSTAVLSCPVRHMHTSHEIADKEDLVSYARLLGAFLQTA